MKFKKPKWLKKIQKEGDKVAKALDPSSIQRDAQKKANQLALDYKIARGGGGDFEDCVVVVAAALGASGGVPMARIACRKVFP